MKHLLACALFLAVRVASAEWTVSSTTPLDAPRGLEFVRKLATNAGTRAELHIVTFATQTHTFAVMDDPKGAFDLATAAQHRGALAAVNGGYFHPNREPLGLVVRQGVTLHSLERARLLSGLVVVSNDRVALLRVSEFKPSRRVQEALQAGPFLIDNRRPVAGLNDTRVAARTVVFSTESGRAGLLVCRSVTLADMAGILANPAMTGDTISRALNLDGGSSTGMWVDSTPPFYLREGRDVRNYLGVIAKKQRSVR